MPTSRSIASATGSFQRRSSIWRSRSAWLRARWPSTSPEPFSARTQAALDGVPAGMTLLRPAKNPRGRQVNGGGGSRAGAATLVSAKPAEEPADVADQEIRRLHGREVAAAVELRPVYDVVAALPVAPDGDVLGEHRHTGRRRAGLLAPGAGVHVLVVQVS